MARRELAQLRFLATRLVRDRSQDLRWYTLWRLAPARPVALPLLFGVAFGAVAGVGARLSGYPTGVWWGLAAGVGFAALLWVASRPGGFRDRYLRMGLYGGLAVGLPGAFACGQLDSLGILAGGIGAVLAGTVLGLVCGLTSEPVPAGRAAAVLAAAGGFAAGVIAWFIAAMVCGVPEGAEQEYADRLPGGATFTSLQALRSAASFGYADQLRIGAGFAVTVAVVVATATGLSRSEALVRWRAWAAGADGSTAFVTLAVCGVIGALGGRFLAVDRDTLAGGLFGAAFGLAFDLIARPHRFARLRARSEALRESLYLWLRVGLVGGLIGGFASGLLLPGPYRGIGLGRLGEAGYAAADGVQAGLALGLMAGLVFGLMPRPSEGLLGDMTGPGRYVVWPLLGAGVGLLMGIALDVALGKLTRPGVGDRAIVLTYVVAGLVLGLVSAVGAFVERRAALRGDTRIAWARRTAFGTATALAVTGGVATWLVTSATLGVTAAVMAAVMVLGTSTWGVYTLTRLRLALTGRLPFRLSRFLGRAHDLGILRTSGSGYQFRHELVLRTVAGEAVQQPTPTAGTAPRVRTAVVAGLAAIVLLLVAVLAPRPDSGDGGYFAFEAAVAGIDPMAMEGDVLVWDVARRGLAAEAEFTQSGSGAAGVNLPGAALVVVSCRGEYRAMRPYDIPAVSRTIHYRYLPVVHTGSRCTNSISLLVRDARVRVFVNRVAVDEFPVSSPWQGPIPMPGVVQLGHRGKYGFLLIERADLWLPEPH